MRTIAQVSALGLVLAILSLPAGATTPVPGKEKITEAVYQPKSLSWVPKIAFESAMLRVTGPSGFVYEREFTKGNPVFDLAAMPAVQDGQYNFDLVFGKPPSADLEKALEAEAHQVDGILDRNLASQVDALPERISGTFRVEGGQIMLPTLVEPGEFGPKVLLTASDGTIRNSLCVGNDCLDNESFSFDTIKLKENNTRILFDDTSASPFPANDWQLVANDSASGGASRFSIEDVTGGKIPFTTTAGAPTDSLFIASSGRVGFRTSTPVLDLHLTTSNTPGIRLEQNSSGGFTAQTWDIAGNETNFFIRDVTSGSRLPFRIRPGAPSDSLHINAAGNVGVGLASHTERLQAFSNTSIVRFRLGNSTNVNAFDFAQAGVDSYVYNLLAGSMRFGTANLERLTITSAGNVGIGTAAPLQRLHVNGNAVVAGSTFIGGNLQVAGACCGPDYVFDPGFKLASIEENAAYMWKHRHLPAVGPARTTEDGQGIINVYAQTNGMLEELEKAHIYIEKLHHEIKKLRSEAAARDAEIRAELAALRERLSR